MYRMIMRELNSKFLPKEKDPDKQLPRPLRVETVIPLVCETAIDGVETDAVEDLDPAEDGDENGAGEDSTQSKPPPEPISGLITENGLKPLMNDKLFISDLRDKLQSLFKLFVN